MKLEDLVSHVKVVIWVNLLLDIVYLLAGMLLLKFSFKPNGVAALYKGFGWAVLVQGAGLFVLDSFFLANILIMTFST